MKDIIKKLLREAIDTIESGNINESATKKEVIDFILDFNYLLSLNLAMVKNQAKEGIKKFKGESSLNTWLSRIMVNHAINYLKAKNKKLNVFKKSYKNI
jgi:hypothetical protein